MPDDLFNIHLCNIKILLSRFFSPSMYFHMFDDDSSWLYCFCNRTIACNMEYQSTIKSVPNKIISMRYLNGWTKHLNETIKDTGPFSFKRLPVEKTFVNGKSGNRLALTKANIFHGTVNKCINILLQKRSNSITSQQGNYFKLMEDGCRSHYSQHIHVGDQMGASLACYQEYHNFWWVKGLNGPAKLHISINLEPNKESDPCKNYTDYSIWKGRITFVLFSSFK